MNTSIVRLRAFPLAMIFLVMISCPVALYAQGVLFVENERVGIGTETPSRALDVDATDDIQSNVFRLLRNGAVRYRLENSAIGVAWDVTNNGNGLFAFQRVGLAQNLMSINLSGQVALGCNVADHDLVISPGPNCTTTPRSWIDAGDTMFSISSSRSVKENLIPVDGSDILDKLGQIKVYTYDFMGGPKDRLGLVAEEFHKIFQRGSEEVLNGQEVQMALWLGVQELAEENAELREQNRLLMERLERLEDAVLGQ